MLEAKWRGTLMLAAAWAGLAWAQSTAPSAPAKNGSGEKVITVQEFGKKPQACRILKSWREREGMCVFEVVALDGGDRMTIVESGPIGLPGGKIQAMTTRIYHWMKNTPPPGTPMPPPDLRAPPPYAVVPVKTPVASAPVDGEPGGVSPRRKQTAVGPVAPAVDKPADVAKGPELSAKPGLEPAPPSDWHLSWGKPDDHKSKAAETGDLPHADASRPDPLKDPEKYSSVSADDKATEPEQGESADDKESKDEKKAETEPAADTHKQADNNKPVTKPTRKATNARMLPGLKRWMSRQGEEEESEAAPNPAMDRRSAAGARSVMAAGMMPGQVYYVPAPMVTLPPVLNQPSYPAPQPTMTPPAPIAPPTQLRANVQNAFTQVVSAPSAPAAEQAPQEEVNAFTKVPQQQGQMADMGGMNSSAFGAPQGAPMMVQGPPMAPMQNPYAMRSPVMPMPVPVLPAQPMQGPASRMAMRQPTGMPMMMPQPMAQSVVPVSMPMTMPQSLPQASTPPPVDVAQTLLVLRNSLYPSHREWAAETLSGINWMSNPMVVESLMQAAREDPAPSVRCACIHSLGNMNINTITVVDCLRSLKTDQDPLVRHEAENMLKRFGVDSKGPAIQPVSAKE